MFVFEAEQKSYDVGGVVFGGQPGEYPTVLAASIFYLGDRLIIDEMAGEFDREKAYEAVEAMRETCAKASVPLIIDMIGGSPKAMENYVEWIAPTGLPFYVDGTTPKVRLAGARNVEVREDGDDAAATGEEIDLGQVREGERVLADRPARLDLERAAPAKLAPVGLRDVDPHPGRHVVTAREPQ